MRRSWRSNRVFLLVVSLAACGVLVVLSRLGILTPVEGILAVPFNAISGLFNRAALSITGGVTDLAELQSLRARNADLEEALAAYQSELVELREIASDYNRLSDLLAYTRAVEDQEFVTAEVISIDTNSTLRTITINRGVRDGVAFGMPVVVREGLVGRVMEVTATASRVLLVTDRSSNVNARLQTTRVQGSVVGNLPNTLLMEFLPIGGAVEDGDLVITSGLGGNFPSDIVIGQVISSEESTSELYQTAQIRSLVSFDTLEFVLVITSFTPVDLSVFLEEEAAAPGGP